MTEYDYDYDPPKWKCDKCGAEITTGLMAVFCPLGKECEFYPEDVEGQAFVEELRVSVETAL